MTIKSIYSTGLEDIYDGCRYYKEANINGFGKNATSYLNHTLVSIYIEDLTSIELFCLKKFASRIEILGKKYKNFTKTEDSAFSYITKLINLKNNILNDTDINNEEINPQAILPIGAVSYSVLAYFDGESIPSLFGIGIFGIEFNKIFKDADGNFAQTFPDYDNLNNNIANAFYENFYKFTLSYFKDVDAVTDFCCHKKFYDYSDGLVTLAQVLTPCGEISFFSDSSEFKSRRYDTGEQIERIKEYRNSLPNNLIPNSYIVFVMNTTMDTFLKFYFYTNYISDYEDFNIVNNNDEITIADSIKNKYYTRITNNIAELAKIKHDPDKFVNTIHAFNLISGGTKIHYCLKIPFSDFQFSGDNYYSDDKILLSFNETYFNKKEIEFAEIYRLLIRYTTIITNILA